VKKAQAADSKQNPKQSCKKEGKKVEWPKVLQTAKL